MQGQICLIPKDQYVSVIVPFSYHQNNNDLDYIYVLNMLSNIDRMACLGKLFQHILSLIL